MTREKITMGWAAKSVSLLLVSGFLLVEAGYGEERSLNRHPAPTQRLRVVPEQKLLELPSRHTIFWNKPGHSVSSLYTQRIGCNLAPKGWRYANYSPYGGELYKSSSFDDRLLTRGNAEKRKKRQMGVGEQVAEAYFGGVVGGLLGTYITWRIIQTQRETEEEWGGVSGYLALVGGTAGVSVGSAVWLNIQRGGNSRRFGWTLLGATMPPAFMITIEYLLPPVTIKEGHFPWLLILNWVPAPIGAVIGYNLAD